MSNQPQQNVPLQPMLPPQSNIPRPQYVAGHHNAPQRPPTPPSSPWRQKYGTWPSSVATAQRDPVRHSGIAPMLPWLDPTFFADDATTFAMMQPFPRPTDEELDLLFGTERDQVKYNAGLTTWEQAIWAEYLINGWAGGHRRGGSSLTHMMGFGYGVDVDESQWHPIFAKDKWYDFRRPILDQTYFPNGIPGITPYDVWSVDIQPLWKELRVVIELVNRWFRYMATDLFLNHIFYEPAEEWQEAGPLRPPPNEPHKLGPNFKPYRVRADGRGYNSVKTLKDIADKLGPRIVWTFFDDDCGITYRPDGGDLHGWTTKVFNNGVRPHPATPASLRQSVFVPISIHIQALRPLLDPNATLAERVLTTTSLAVTMLHETIHAVGFTRNIDNPLEFDEPYYNNEWEAELGSSGINSLFGSDLSQVPYSFAGNRRGFKFGTVADAFPPAGGSGKRITTLNNYPVRPLGSVSSPSTLPNAWASSLQLKTFYATVLQKYGLAAFKVPRLFEARRVHRGFYTRQHRARLVRDPQIILQGAIHTGLDRDVGNALNALEERRLQWRRLRPWYHREYLHWQLTPYANTDARSITRDFYDAVHPFKVAVDPLRAELRADNISWAMIHFMIVHHVGPHEARWPRSLWFYNVLAYIMVAVLPARVSARGDYPMIHRPNPWHPSATCNSPWRFPPKHTLWEHPSYSWELPDRHTGTTHITAPGPYGTNVVVGYKSSRVWILEQAVMWKQSNDTIFPLPEPLSRALDVELHSLMQQAYNKPNDQWLEFRFQFPPYSKDFVTRDMLGHFVPWTGPRGIQNTDFEYSPVTPPHAPPAQPAPPAQAPPPAQGPPGAQAQPSARPQRAPPPAPPPQAAPRAKSQPAIQAQPAPPPAAPAQAAPRALSQPAIQAQSGAQGPAVKTGSAQVVPGRRRRGTMRLAQPKTRYFTVSEVGDKAPDNRTGTNWALVDDGMGGYDVVDVSDILRNDASLDFDDVFERTALGRQVVSEPLLDAINDEGKEPLGKLLMWKHIEEVSEHDGQDGRDLWCVLGDFVYDITDFPFRSEDEKEALIAFTTKNVPQGKALEGLDVPSLVRRLAPFKCGFLRQAPPSAPLPQRTFTLRELGRYIFPEIGMYAAIDGTVYDIGRYLHSHPGGTEILHQYAGLDATHEFQEAHSDWVQALEETSFLKVGRLVEERPRTDEIDDDEVALLDRVFRISALAAEDTPLYLKLAPYLGTDATEATKDKNAPQCLGQLFDRDDLIVAKLVDVAPRRITVSELKEHSHIPTRAERMEPDDVSDWRVWVAEGSAGDSGRQMVYDVTAMVMFGGSDVEKSLRPWLGKEVDDREVAEWLRTRHESFIIGELAWGGGHTARRAHVLEPERHSRAGMKRQVGGWYGDEDDGVETRKSKYVKVRR